jgi:integrase
VTDYPTRGKSGPRDAAASGAPAPRPRESQCTTSLPAGLTPALIARLYRDAMRDNSYRDSPVGAIVAQYLRHKSPRLTPPSQRSYEGSLANLARFFADLPDLRAFEPPLGTQIIEDYLDVHWSPRHHAAGTYNTNLAITSDFFKWAQAMALLAGNPTLAIERARGPQAAREIFSPDDRRRILAANPELRDRIALRLLLDYALRKGSLQRVQFRDFDHHRRRLTVRLKGGKLRELPLPEPMFWRDLERHILEIGAQGEHYLMASSKVLPNKRRIMYPDKPMSASGGMHRWWYGCLQRAGVVADGVSAGERMHKARHTAGQRLLDDTGNLKAVQKFLGHASIRTTADIYVDWDLDQLSASLERMLRRDAEGEDHQTGEDR